MRLFKQTRLVLVEILTKDRLANMFSDCMSKEYVKSGVYIIGLDSMTDDDLVDEYGLTAEHNDDLLIKCLAELSINRVLKS